MASPFDIADTIGNTVSSTISNVTSQISSIKNNLRLLFDRPMEPMFLPRGDGNSTVFDFPSNFLPNKYQSLISDITSQFTQSAKNKISLKNITLPDISVPLQLGRHDQFSLFLPDHQRMAGRLIDILMKQPSLEDFQSAAVYCREQLNPYLFNYALSVVMLHRPDTRDVAIPNIAESFPDKYFDRAIFCRAREQLGVIPSGSRQPIPVTRNFTGTDADPEHRVAYFREDIGINLHHWHWHLVYPFTAEDRTIVEKDRRGELFYHMHHQMVARYNAERFSHQLPRVRPLDDLNEIIPEGYFPKLDSTVASRTYPPRFANIRLNNLNRPNNNLVINIQDIGQWRNNITTALEQGYVVDSNNNRIELTEERGVDIIGNILESSILNPNPTLYGNIHNAGHMLIGYVHDPDNRYLEGFSVMGDSGTAMRDPIFYRWHSFIDQIFDDHKSRLPQYTVQRLEYQGISVTGVQIESQGGQPNQMQTFWEQSDLDLSAGLDFGRREPLYVRFTHLQHRPFSYRINVNNDTQDLLNGTVRIFMAPQTDETGARLTFEQQRLLMIEMDRFRVGMRPGQNTIVRQSSESSVTIPYNRTFRNLNIDRRNPNSTAVSNFNFCGCGWPQHMLIPRGTEQGMAMDVFVMISNYVNDRITQDLVGFCNDADSFCGVNQRRYPDMQSMGFPFDRPARNGVASLTDFLTPNMFVQQATITHTDTTTVRSRNAIY